MTKIVTPAFFLSEYEQFHRDAKAALAKAVENGAEAEEIEDLKEAVADSKEAIADLKVCTGA